MLRSRALAASGVVALCVLAGGLAAPRPALAASEDVVVTAFLDGKPIPIAAIPNFYCDDFSFPVIECSVRTDSVEARASIMLAAGVEYVTIYDQSNYGGAYMNVSQDYTALLTVGWNDRVSSFKGRNSETGVFYIDWFYGGTSWSFCCNTQTPSLGSYNNTFSSVRRT
jgi:hypothetical protein